MGEPPARYRVNPGGPCRRVGDFPNLTRMVFQSPGAFEYPTRPVRFI